MSGIVGTYRLDGAPAEAAALTQMTDALAHRGPDGTGRWREGSVALGQLMLHTTPESLHETLPLTDPSGRFTITADARIDNRADLIGRLGVNGKPTEEIADSELILAAYKTWGADCPDKLLGAFAFAVWDEREHRLFCARDHYGVKPFFYYHRPGRLFAFASEIKALLCLDAVPRTLNERGIARHMLMPVEDNAADTFYEDVRVLKPAHAGLVRPGAFHEHRYWALDPEREVRLGSDEAYAEALRERFVEAVRCRLRSAYPVGAMLSGGLDSSAVTCTAAHLQNEDPGAHGRGRLHTLSAVFDNVPESDERSFIEQVTSTYDVEPHYFHADRHSPLADLDATLWHLDRPNESGNLYLNWNLYRTARRHGARVVLSGFDGDTTLSHGRHHLNVLARAGRWRALLPEVRAYAQRIGEPWKEVVWAWIRKFGVDPFISRCRPLRFARRVWRGLRRRLRSRGNASGAVGGAAWEDVLAPAFAAEMKAHLDEAPSPPASTEREHHHRLLTRSLMPRTLESLNATAAAHGVALRLPFCDKRLMEFCLALPPEQKMRHGWTRLVMRHAMRGLLPERIRWRPGKSDLGPSFDHGLLTFAQEPMSALVHDDLGDVSRYVDLDVLRAVYQQSVSGANSGSLPLLFWRALSLALWLQTAGSSSSRSLPRPQEVERPTPH
jgi:asparagine synthase (glutamine-hydrolysing)